MTIKLITAIVALVAALTGAGITIRNVFNVRIGKGAPAWAGVLFGITILLTALTLLVDVLKGWDAIEAGARKACTVPGIASLCRAAQEAEAEQHAKVAAAAEVARQKAIEAQRQADAAERDAVAKRNAAEAATKATRDAVDRKAAEDRRRAEAEARRIADDKAASQKKQALAERVSRLMSQSHGAFMRRDFRMVIQMMEEVMGLEDEGIPRNSLGKAYHNRGCAYFEMGNRAQAASDFRRALAIDSSLQRSQTMLDTLSRATSC